MPRPDFYAVCRLALEALVGEPMGVRPAVAWSKRQAEIRAGARVALRGALDEADDPTLENDIAQYIRVEMSYCPCQVPRDCQRCRVREELLTRLGYWSKAEAEPICTLPASEPAVEGTRTILDGPAKPALALVDRDSLASHDGGRS